MASTRTAVLVVAMHRSGTSAVARTLNLLGCDMAPDLLPADQWNSSGYWESRSISQLNEQILNAGGASWHEWQEFSSDWLHSSALDRFRDRAVEALEKEFGASSLFVVKDPRFSLLMPFWRSVFDRIGVEPVAVHPVRHPMAVARSLERRDGFLMAKGLLLWLRYALESERGTRGLRRFFATYEQLLDDPADLIDRSQATLGLRWPRNSDRVRREIGAYLDRGSDHRDKAGSTQALAYAGNWIDGAYGILSSWAATGEKEGDRATLDALLKEFNAGAHAFGAIARDNDERFASIVRMQEEQEALRGARQAAEKKAEESESRLETLEGIKAELEQKVAAISRQAEDLLKSKAALEERYAVTQKERDQLRDLRLKLEQERAAAIGEKAALTSMKAELEERIMASAERADAVQRAKVALEQRHLATQKERDRLRDQQARLQADHAAAAAEREALQSEKAALEARLAEAEQQQVQLRAAGEELERKAAAATERSEALHKAKSALEEKHLATQMERDALRAYRAKMEAEHAEALKEKEALAQQLASANERSEAAQKVRRALEERARALQAERDSLRENRAKAEEERDSLVAERDALLEEQRIAGAGRDAEAANLSALVEAATEAQAVLASQNSALEAEVRAREEAVEALKRDLEKNAAMLAGRDRELATLTLSFAQSEQEAQKQRQGASRIAQTEQLARQWEEESRRLNEELEQVRNSAATELEALKNQLAQTESALRQRQLETEQAAEELQGISGKVEAERAMHAAQQAELGKQIEGLREEVAGLERARAAAVGAMKIRFDEIALITRHLAEREQDLVAVRGELQVERADRQLALAQAQEALQEVREDLQRQKEIVRAAMLASQADLASKQEILKRDSNHSLALYYQHMASIEAMLADAVLPFPALTRKRTLAKQRDILETHAQFDADWYVRNNPDVQQTGADPVDHFITHGVRERRAPNEMMEALRASAAFHSTQEP